MTRLKLVLSKNIYILKESKVELGVGGMQEITAPSASPVITGEKVYSGFSCAVAPHIEACGLQRKNWLDFCKDSSAPFVGLAP